MKPPIGIDPRQLQVFKLKNKTAKKLIICSKRIEFVFIELMTKWGLLILCVLFSCNSFAQEKTIIKGKLQGEYFDKTSINIINQRNETGVNSDLDGHFEIEVIPGDTLIVSSVQFKRLKKVITEKIIEERNVTIDLELQVNELDEVLLSNIDLSGNLTLDLEDIEVIDKSKFGLPYIEEKTRTEKKLQAANRNFFAKFANSLNGKTNRLEEIKKIEEKRNLVDRAINAVPQSLFEDADLPSNLIRDFIYYCARNPNFHLLLEKERRLELVEYYQMKIPKFLKDRE